jgi:hypothetical protein
MGPKSNLTVDEAKALVKNGLGEVMARYPARFCKPVMFGVPPSREDPARVNNGTATLLRRGAEYLAVTCFHVLKPYRKVAHDNPSCFFAIGNCHFNLLPQIIIEDEAIDVCVIRLTGAQESQIVAGNIGIGEQFFELGAGPAAPAKIDDYVAFAGFPGDLRRLQSLDAFNFGVYSSGAARVTDQHSDYMICRFEREHWIRSIQPGEQEPESLGGMSGGPAFVIRHSPAGVISYDFCGIVFKMHEASESLFIRNIHAILSSDLAEP